MPGTARRHFIAETILLSWAEVCRVLSVKGTLSIRFIGDFDFTVRSV